MDKDHSGKLTSKEIKDVLDDICERYPQVELYLKSKQMKNFVDLLRDAEGSLLKESKELDIEEFKKALAHVDSQVKMLPATAQVIFLIIITNVGDRTGVKRFLQFIYGKHPLEDSAKSFSRVMVLQVAAQQGNYLAQCFNKMKICEEHPEGPLRIRGQGRHRFHPFR